jgi:hypothetical protein
MKENLIEDYSKIGGWLYLVAFGLFGTAFSIAFELIKTYVPIFTNGTWANLVASPQLKPLSFLIIIEIVLNIILMLFSIILLFQMRVKHPLFPRNTIILYVSILCFSILDQVLYNILITGFSSDQTVSYEEIAKAFGTCVIWIPYLLISKRVKGTFKTKIEL